MVSEDRIALKGESPNGSSNGCQKSSNNISSTDINIAGHLTCVQVHVNLVFNSFDNRNIFKSIIFKVEIILKY